MESIAERGADAGPDGVSHSGIPSEAPPTPEPVATSLPPRIGARLRTHRLTGSSTDRLVVSDFARFWAAQSISQVGTQFTAVAFPLLAALSLGASPMAFGVLAAASGLPHLLFGLFAGAWIDRVRRRPVMIAADIGRAALLLAIPVAAWLDHLSIALLIAIAFSTETLTVFFDIAYLSYLPALVPRRDLVTANSRLEASASGAQVVGPAFGGGIVRLLGAPAAVLVDTLSYVASAVLLWRIEQTEEPPAAAVKAGLLAEIRQGLATLWRNPVLRALALSSAITNLAGFLFLSIYVLYMTRYLGLDAAAVGLVFGAGGVGALLGSLLAGPARGRWGMGPVLVGSQVLFGLFGVLVPLAVLFPSSALPLIVAAEFLQWVTVLVYSINAVSLRQSITPDHLLGRVNGSMRCIVWGMRPLGSLLGGFLGGQIGLPATLVVGAVGMMLAFLPLLRSPIPRLRRIGAA